ncbi:sel1 repeat family protein [Celeribacter ethanolicus]|uniref:sel1 repeat family protein n=1 Tax=Celeribacter ethanolicus TaxID=1758178 RepID=UPI000829D65E|nr:sel1 repeat family protein [Celeribacter ethanolicus]
MRLPVLTALTALLSLPALADPLPSYWQDDRDFYNEIADAACVGSADDSDFDRLITAAIQEANAPAMIALRWMVLSESCVQYNPDGDLLTNSLMVMAALQAYPIAQSNLAGSYLHGYYGIEQNPDEAEALYDQAIQGGYGEAASEYARALIEGDILTRDLDKAADLLAVAEREGVEAATLAPLRTQLSELGGAEVGEPHIDPSWDGVDTRRLAEWLYEGLYGSNDTD